MEGLEMVSVVRILIAMALVLILLTYLLLHKGTNPVIALLGVAIILSIGQGTSIVENITEGFGGTIANTGIIVILSNLILELLKLSGGMDKISSSFIKVFGNNKEEIGLSLIGSLVAIPIHPDTSFLLLSTPLKSIATKTTKSIVGLGLALGSAVFITGTIIPFTPGPYGVTQLYGANVVDVFKYGIIIVIPMIIANLFYSKKFRKYEIPVNLESIPDENKNKPSFILSFLPIVLPIVLITIKTVLKELNYVGNIVTIFEKIGEPIVALSIGLFIGYFTLGKNIKKEDVSNITLTVLKKAGMIILILGASGSIGMVLRASNLSEYVGNLLVNSNIPTVLIPFLIATFIRFIQGNEVVAMLSTGAIMAQNVGVLDMNPIVATLATCTGSMFFSYFNDRFFWLFGETIGIKKVSDKVKTWSVSTTISWFVGLIMILILNFALK